MIIKRKLHATGEVKKSLKTGGNLIINKNFLADESITTAAKTLRLSTSKLSYLFEAFIKVGEKLPCSLQL